MSLGNWLDRAEMQVDQYGPVAGSKAALGSLVSGVSHRLSGLYPRGGTNVYDDEWDLLLVLDACRVDALEAVAPEYDFVPNAVPSIRSVAPNSHLWMERTFAARPEAVADTTYVTANGHVEDFDGDQFARLEKVYEHGFDRELETIPPRAVTDATVSALRSDATPRTIAHYMQPHTPYRSLGLDGLGGGGDKAFRETVWDWILAGKLSRDEAWEHYLDNLRWVLDDVELLLRSVDADRVVVTADHGEAYGEWGAYGHSATGEFDGLRRVPWVVTDATDDGEYEPTAAESDDEQVDVDEQLKYLGYV
ncbi:hypothetical protein [Halogeometricum sp. CBA1124]|uniref:hypothetical protein n=1 Tax=Halogeometricum sp. CBA1124 TaxID=2668071 RepID=UPI0014294C78|nr:hypothetical protein [Halogeometricum sp. CBA1124]MUV58300.1 hypothetical protein [Halogeometricum sp. CBA1124]